MPNGASTIGILADYAAMLADLKAVSGGSDMQQWAGQRAGIELAKNIGEPIEKAVSCSRHDPATGKCIEGQQE
jgi:hypothetical protein